MATPPVTDLDGVRVALGKWYDSGLPDASLVVLFDPMELGTLHYILAEYQQMIEEVGVEGPFDELYGSIRHKIEHTLSQAGYGGDPRP